MASYYLNLNRAQIIGRLGKDPEIRNTTGGNAVCTFSVATEHSYKRKDDADWTKETDWHKVVVWGRQAEWLAKNVGKGDIVFVEGRMVTRNYDDKDGIKRYVTEIVADTVQITSKGGGGGRSYGGGGEFSGGQSGQGSNGGGRPAGGNRPDDDIPF